MKVVLVGKGGSGKDFLKKKMIAQGFKPEISCTDRPMREGEVEGKDYNFISKEKMTEFNDLGLFETMIQYGNGFRYATTKKQFREAELFIKTPSGIALLKPEDRKDFFVIFLDIPYDVRKERLLARSDSHDAERRLRDDESDFKDFKDYDLRITNPDF